LAAPELSTLPRLFDAIGVAGLLRFAADGRAA